MFLFSRLYNAFRHNTQTIETIDSLDEDIIEVTPQSAFTNKILSQDMSLFIYQSITLEPFTNKFFHYKIIRERKLWKKTIYTVICKDTNKKIMYFIENKKYHKNYYTYNIFLNYTPRKYVGYLPKDLEKLIYSFNGKKYNTKIKDGLYLGRIITNKKYFSLDINKSSLLNSDNVYINDIMIIKQIPDKTIQLSRRVKKTLINIKKMKLNKKTKEISGHRENFKNQEPDWNEETRSYLLNFHGHAKLSSSKNTILNNKYNNNIAMFGKMEKNEYLLSIKYPFSLIQGVGFAISCLNK